MAIALDNNVRMCFVFIFRLVLIFVFVPVEFTSAHLGVEVAHPSGREGFAENSGPPVLPKCIVRMDTAKGCLINDINNAVDDNVGDNAADETVGNRVGERHDSDGDKCWDSVAGIIPVDIAHAGCHHGTDDDQGRASRPRREAGKDRREENRDEEAESDGDSCDTGATAFGDTRTGFNKGCARRTAKACADNDTDSVGHESVRRVLKIARFVSETTVSSHRVHGAGCIQDINVQERDKGDPNFARREIKVELGEYLVDRVDSDDLFEVVELHVAGLGVREIRDVADARPGCDRNKHNGNKDGTADTEHEQDNHDEQTENTHPGRR